MTFFLEQPQIMNIPSQVAGFVDPVFMAAGHVRPVQIIAFQAAAREINRS
jgi:hypothetical protein